jgi:beta-glucosidase-like glycosyl hydrolase
MVMPRINGPQLADPLYRAQMIELVKEGIGGFILFGGDVESTPQYLKELQSHADVPLLISSDVERGLGQQLSGGTRFPSQRAVASAVNRRSKKDEDLLNRMLDAVRIETRAAGIHAVFSPVMDVNNNPDNPIICTRAFGEEPEEVEWFGSRYIKRLQRQSKNGGLDLLACAKHYPGHGDTDQDSHSVLPEIRADRARLNRVELPPFRESVKDGVAMVMVAHLLVHALDPEKPVTFSKKAVTALLREGMEFDGLIVSDALDMGALAGRYSQEEIAVRAVEAGMDILLHPVDARVTVNAVVSAVEQGRLTRERIQESLVRILSAKKRLGLFEKDRHAGAEIDYGKHREIARKLGRKALKVISGDKKHLPMDAAKGAACYVLDDDTQEGTGSVLLSEMMKRFASFSGTVLTPAMAFSREHAKSAIDPAASVVIAVFSKISASKGRSGISPMLKNAAVEILGMAKSAGKLSIVISFDSPYILSQFRDADILIAAYDRMDEIQQAAAEMLAGR